jgi:carboxylesterase
MKMSLEFALRDRRWSRQSIRRIIFLAAILLFAGGALFGIGQLQAYQAMPPVKPFHHQGNGTGVLLIHGFGGSPLELQPLTESLAQNGYTVSAPLLPGHGTTPRDFAATSNAEYLEAVRGELSDLRSQCQRLYVVGFSMGGLLALQIERETRLDGLVLMSTPIQPWNDLADFDWLKVAAESGTKLHLFFPTLGIPNLVQARRREQHESPSQLPEVNYAAYPAASCLHVLELIEQVKPQLHSIRTPTLIMQSRDDHVSAPSSADYLYDHLGSEEKRLVYLQHSGHVIALGRERDRVEQLVARFVASGCLR